MADTSGRPFRSVGITPEQAAEMVHRYSATKRERLAKIAADFGVTSAAVIYHARKAGIDRRQEHTSKGVCRHCGNDFVYVTSHAARAPRLFCTNPCRTAGYRGEMHGNYKAFATMTPSNGYRTAPIPDGHVTRSRSGKQKNRAPEHVLIVERVLGRALRRGEVVHHINGDTADNRNSNLLVCSRGYHGSLHYRMSLLYQREHFARVN